MDTFSIGMQRMAQNGSLPVRIPANIEAERLRRYEHEIFSLFDQRIIISGQDRDCIPHPDRTSIHVIPNGVDMEFFRQAEKKEEPEFELMFNGNMSYPPNIASAVFAAREIMPLLREKRPGIRLLIAGPNPVAKVKALADGNTVISGWMNDIRDAYTKSRIMIAPMLISIGLQNKILQAMSMKVPCIVSGLANNAIGAIPGKHLLIADTPKEWQSAIELLLDNEDLCRQLADSAYTFVQDNFNWEQNALRIAGLLNTR
jgi:glycosyltransferase involved in cell wall biosynthesis